ncbi:MAG: hypothetical protein ACJ780_31490 [Solirubrobacteraceae bacterium]
MSETDTEVDYQGHLGQSDHWPRMNNGSYEERPIHEMNPGHAINAFHVLLDWGKAKDFPQIKYTNLAQALLTRAAGEQVVFATDTRLPDSPPVDGPSLDEHAYQVLLDLEKCYDALEAISDHTHPVTRARELLRALMTP